MRTDALRQTSPVAFISSYQGEPQQVALVRADLALVLEGCPVADDCALAVSEFAANAVLHTRSGLAGGVFCVRLEAYAGDYVRVEVADEGGTWASHGCDDECGRGLLIVEAIAGRGNWGIEGDEQGRTAWVRLDWNGTPSLIRPRDGSDLSRQRNMPGCRLCGAGRALRSPGACRLGGRGR